MSKIVLGLNCYHADASASIIIDNKVIAAVEEERLNRIKHFAGFPVNSIKFCLKEAKIQMQDVDLICLNTNPKANLLAKANYLLKSKGIQTILEKAKNKIQKKNNIKNQIKKKLN